MHMLRNRCRVHLQGIIHKIASVEYFVLVCLNNFLFVPLPTALPFKNEET